MPDFLVNRMGIVNCADEQYGTIDDEAALAPHLDQDSPNGIYRLARSVLTRADETGETTASVARALAVERSFETHPVWGHRGSQIIERLGAEGWGSR